MKRFTLIRASGRYSSSTSVVAAELTAPMPHVIVTGRFGSLQGRHDELQRFEGRDESFKRAFNIWTTDSAFATAVFDPLMTEWMLSLGRTYAFEVNGARAFACGGSRRPRDVDGLIDACSGFVQRLPAPDGW